MNKPTRFFGRNKPRQDFLSGKMLIATPDMGDPRFDHALIFMCAHDERHAMGLIVNKPLEGIFFSELLDQLEISATEPEHLPPVFFGGPVQTERGAVIHSLDYQTTDTIQVTDEIGVTASTDILRNIANQDLSNGDVKAPRQFMLAVGHAGWSGGQLEREISENAWAHCDADSALIFDGQEEMSWGKALATLGIDSAMLSTEWSASHDVPKRLH